VNSRRCHFFALRWQHKRASFHERFTMKKIILPNAQASTISPFVLILRAGCFPAFRLPRQEAGRIEALSAANRL